MWVPNNPNYPAVQWCVKALLKLVSHVSPEMAVATTAVAISVVGLVLVWKRKTVPAGEPEIEERKRLVVGENFEAIEVHRRVRLTLPKQNG